MDKIIIINIHIYLIIMVMVLITNFVTMFHVFVSVMK